MDPSLSRSLWQQLEAINAVTYFAPECRAANTRVGLRGFWMGYFGARACPLGAVPAGVVEATFYNFHPAMVRRAVPDAWRFAAPDAIVVARADAAAAAIRRLAPDATAAGARVLPALCNAIDGADGAGRPLFAANRDVGMPLELDAAIWQAATTMREHRGDGHVAVLVEAGLDGCEAHVLFAATEAVSPSLLREARGWTETDWEHACHRLADRGLVTTAGGATTAGRDLRGRIEARTDELAVLPYEQLGAAGAQDLLAALTEIAQPIVAAGEMPFPNPMGLPRPE
jgi:hypothetical protein